jgi:hypothetical protein
MSLEKSARPVAFFCSPSAVNPDGFRMRMPVRSNVRFADSSSSSAICRRRRSRHMCVRPVRLMRGLERRHDTNAHAPLPYTVHHPGTT